MRCVKNQLEDHVFQVLFLKFVMKKLSNGKQHGLFSSLGVSSFKAGRAKKALKCQIQSETDDG